MMHLTYLQCYEAGHLENDINESCVAPRSKEFGGGEYLEILKMDYRNNCEVG